MPDKDVYVILAFHAHEPWWDLPSHILSTLDDKELRQSVPPENWVRRRAEAGRDVYAQLLDLAQRLGAPMCLEATNELLMQIAECMPQTFERLKRGFASGALYPVYGGAHHAHCALLTVDELADEVRLNQEFLHDVMGAPLPKYRGAFPIEGSVDARKLEAFRRAGINYLIFPNLSPRKAHYAFDGEAHPPHEPFVMEHGIIGLPRHFGVSQDIWRPITRWKPEGLKAQGYILGMYWVFDEEYREQRHILFPITREEAIAQYRDVLERAVAEAPDDGLLLYIQDLELMDYGEEALEILGEVFSSLRARDARVHIVTPDEYIDRLRLRERALPRLRFYQVSWAPEIRPVLRADGHYPPLDAGPFRGVDFSLEGFRRWPFIFWEWGRFHVEIFNSLLRSFGFPLVVPLSAHDWWERGYGYHDLELEERLALHSRSMKQADNWGWQPDEDRQKRPYLHGYAIATLLLQALRGERVDEVRCSFEPLAERSLVGLERVLEPFVDVRVAYLRAGIERLGERAGERVDWAHHHLQRAEKRRRAASDALRRTQQANRQLVEHATPYPFEGIHALLEAVRDHCREAFLAADEIQRAWGNIADTDGMVVEMYRYLYDLYPPLLPKILRELSTPEELALVEDPPLL